MIKRWWVLYEEMKIKVSIIWISSKIEHIWYNRSIKCSGNNKLPILNALMLSWEKVFSNLFARISQLLISTSTQPYKLFLFIPFFLDNELQQVHSTFQLRQLEKSLNFLYLMRFILKVSIILFISLMLIFIFIFSPPTLLKIYFFTITLQKYALCRIVQNCVNNYLNYCE